jgi:hypothetical protein
MRTRKSIGIAVSAVFVAAIAGAWLAELSRTDASKPRSHDRAIQVTVDAIDERPRSAFQDGLLADGTLTEAEYDLAYALFSECVERAGGTMAGTGAKTSKGIHDSFVLIPPTSSGEANAAAREGAKDCEETYFDVVGARWSAMKMEPPGEVEAALGTVRGCARDLGVELPPLPSGEAVLEFLARASEIERSALDSCLRKASASLGYPSHVGVFGAIP